MGATVAPPRPAPARPQAAPSASQAADASAASAQQAQSDAGTPRYLTPDASGAAAVDSATPSPPADAVHAQRAVEASGPDPHATPGVDVDQVLQSSAQAAGAVVPQRVDAPPADTPTAASPAAADATDATASAGGDAAAATAESDGAAPGAAAPGVAAAGGAGGAAGSAGSAGGAAGAGGADAGGPGAAPGAEGGGPEAASDGGAGFGDAGGDLGIDSADGATALDGADAQALAALGTGDLALIDTELAEHQRWAGAMQHVGAQGSVERAAFIAEQAGSGFLTGAASGFGMGLAMGLASRAVPVLGPILGGAMALHGLVEGWGHTTEAIGRFGEGSDVYEQLANSIDAISAIVQVVSGVLNVINGIVGVVQAAALIIAAGATVVAIVTLGAGAPIAVMAGEVAATCEEISVAIGEVTMVLDNINAGILQPAVLLFRALHAFTTNADPREVESEGSQISAAASASGGALGGMLGAHAANIGAPRPQAPREEEPPVQPTHETPAAPEPPVVRFDEPPTVAHGPEGEPAALPASVEAPAPVRSPAEGEPAPRPVSDPAQAPTIDPTGPTQLPTGPDGMPEIPGPPRLPDIPAPNPDWGTELPGWQPPGPAPDSTPGSTPATTPSRAPTEPVTTPSRMPTAPAEAPAGPAPRRITDEQAPAASTAPNEPTGPSFADVDVSEIANSPFGDRLAAEAATPMRDVPRDTTQTPQAVKDAAYAEIPRDRPAGYGEGPGRDPGIQDQHWTKVRDATVNAPAGTAPATVEAINANRSPLQTFKAGEGTLLLTTEGAPDVNRGTRFFIGDEPMGRPAVPAEPGIPAIPAEPGAVGGPARDADYNSEHRFADRYLIPEEAAKIQAARASAGLPPLDHVQLAVAAGEQARYRMEGVPSTNRAQQAVKPWSGDVIGPERTPMQMLLAPQVLSPNLPAGRTVEVPRPAAPEAPAPVTPAVPEGQLSLSFGEPTPATTGATPRPIAEPTAPTRSTEALTPEQYAAAVDRLVAMGVPRERIEAGDYTAFHPDAAGGDGRVTVGPDLHPLPEGQRPEGLANPANAALGPEAVLAHEAIGHREAEMAGEVRPDAWHEEFQASVRAGLHGDVSPEQRALLLQDAAARRRHAASDDTIYVWTGRAGAPEAPAAAQPARPDSHFRPQDQQPSVIVSPELLQPQTPAEAAAPTRASPRGATEPQEAPTASAATAPGRPASPQQGTATASGPGSTARQVGALFFPQLFGPSGEAQTPAQAEAAHRAQFTGDNQPAAGVERVNPDYPAPPGTPEQLQQMQQEISRLLRDRAAAEQESQHQASRVEQCEANRPTIEQTVDDSAQGLSAVQAHEASIAAHEAANQAQQQRQQQAQGLVSGYPSRATGLAVLEGPLAAWQGFTSLASHLPGDAGDRMLQMNAEANRMQEAFGQMDSQMQGTDAAQPARQAELQGDSARLDATGTQAGQSGEDLRTAQAGAQSLRQSNDSAQTEAEGLQSAADQQAQQLGDSAAQRQEQAQTLSEQLQAWAAAHRAARQHAIAATVQRLNAQGMHNVRVEHGS